MCFLHYSKITRSTRTTEAKLSKLLKNQNPPPIPVLFTPAIPSEMASLLNSRWKNCKERPDRSTNNRDSECLDDIVCLPNIFILLAKFVEHSTLKENCRNTHNVIVSTIIIIYSSV